MSKRLGGIKGCKYITSSVVPVRKKYEFLDYARDSLYFQVLPEHFHFMRGHSLVELTEYDNNSSVADIMAHSVYISVLLHS